MIKAIRTAKPGEIIWDNDSTASVKGLHARVLTGGEVSFYFYYRTKSGKQRKPKIGAFGEITVAEARDRAKILAKQVAIGEDPRGDWEQKKEELTVADVYAKALDKCWSLKEVSPKWRRDIELNWKNHLAPTFGQEKISDVKPRMIKAWQEKLTDKPFVANRSLEALSRMYRFAQEQELIPLGVNPCTLVKALPERKRKRFATGQEIARIGARLEHYAESRPAQVAFQYLLMFAGPRPSVITRAKWEQLEEFYIPNEQGEQEPWGRLTIRGKMTGHDGQEDVVILPPQAMRVIQRLPRIPGATITGIKQPQKFWELIRKEAGCEDLWMRDWRRTFATVGLSDGEKLDTIGELLNHRSTQTTKIYAKLMEHARLKAAGSIASRIEDFLASELPSRPLSLPGSDRVGPRKTD